MFFRKSGEGKAQGFHSADIKNRAVMTAIDRSMAVIQFDTNGNIESANENFLQAMGYSRDEIIGGHHRLFVDPEYAESREYRDFWFKLRSGEFFSAEYRRVRKNGEVIWLQATYNPVFDSHGNVEHIVKFASDITAAKEQAFEDRGLIEALDRSQALIKFSPDGTILHANQNFLNSMGYTLQEIVGKHHSMFVSQDYARSDAYRSFWSGFKVGQFQSEQFERVGKGGKPVWIQATYNPIPDASGVKLAKVIKIASDVSLRVQQEQTLSALIDKDLTGIADHALTVSDQARDMASELATTSGTIRDVAAASEELSASTEEIMRIVRNSRDTADSTQTLTASASDYTVRLEKAAAEMTSIVEIINDIAGQINLLALNATIESARAGEAGKGFAVVASEVKQLASQVSNATSTISGQIDGVQSVSTDVIRALQDISSSMTNIIGNVSEVSNSVEQQAQATQEISNRMQTAAGAVQLIDSRMTDVATSVSDTSRISGEVKENVRALMAS